MKKIEEMSDHYAEMLASIDEVEFQKRSVEGLMVSSFQDGFVAGERIAVGSATGAIQFLIDNTKPETTGFEVVAELQALVRTMRGEVEVESGE